MTVTNLKRLAIARMSAKAIPKGCGVAAAIAFLSDPKALAAARRESVGWAREAVAVLRTAKGGEMANKTDEELAGILLEEINKRTGPKKEVRL